MSNHQEEVERYEEQVHEFQTQVKFLEEEANRRFLCKKGFFTEGVGDWSRLYVFVNPRPKSTPPSYD